MNTPQAQTRTFTNLLPQPVSPFAGLPELLKSVLSHEENTDINLEIQSAHKLTPAQRQGMMKIIQGVILKNIVPANLVKSIQTELQLDVDQATSLARDLLSRRFLAMEWYIGPVQPLIEQLGGDVQTALRDIQRRYPELFPETSGVLDENVFTDSYHLLANFNEWIGTTEGKEEILLRLTNVSMQMEEAIKDGRIPEAEGQKLMADLDAVSYAVNTQDLNHFETHSMRRQIEKFLEAIENRA